MNYHHILAAYDGSKASEKALTHAVKIVGSHPGSRLTVAHVVTRLPYSLAGYGLVLTDGIQEKIQEYENTLLQQMTDKIESLPYASIAVLKGNAATAILEHATENNCDLIIIGNRGLGPIREWMLGSVSHEVVQQAKIPVLIIK
ncbi:universal stress protein [Cohnella abietis]|uniref:Universal stress protein n=1 Tax=Cohnella abietis TaxID=2507935 RepID=A0A3T1D7T3_9BACL|nr:universal stress protein [Cohnella abietis]BBI34134.1 universal stress protein UspA [Cohnella abietis]